MGLKLIRSGAVAMSDMLIMRLVILPQAIRIAMPPLAGLHHHATGRGQQGQVIAVLTFDSMTVCPRLPITSMLLRQAAAGNCPLWMPLVMADYDRENVRTRKGQ